MTVRAAPGRRSEYGGAGTIGAPALNRDPAWPRVCQFRRIRMGKRIQLPDSREIDKVALDRERWKYVLQDRVRPSELAAVVIHFGRFVVFENLVQAAVGAAIGMQQQNDPVRAVQPDGLPHLPDQKFPVGFVLGRREGFSAAGHNDRIGIHDRDALQEFPQYAIEAMIETGHYHRIAVILFRRRPEMENSFHRTVPVEQPRLRSSHLPAGNASNVSSLRSSPQAPQPLN